MKKDLFKVRLFSLAGLFGFMLTLASCTNEDVLQKATNTDNDNNKKLTSFSASAPETRTSLDYNTSAYYWEAGDYIYVQDDDNIWQKSTNTPTSQTASFVFAVPGKFKNKTSYKVYYPGKNGNEEQVVISASQRQNGVNNTAHLGMSGDCGLADAIKGISAAGTVEFRFSIDHQIAILVFQPYLGNDNKLVSTYITKIEVISDNDIAGTFTLNNVTGELTGGTDVGKQITLYTTSTDNYKGLPLNNASPNLATNGAYMVIKPGMHSLKVRYYLRDEVSAGYGSITKNLNAFNYQKNTYYDMTANLKMTDYDLDHFYMWDAQLQYWAGHEWYNGGSQPVLEIQRSNDYPKPNTGDLRYAHIGGGSGRFDATTAHFKTLLNANELSWYVKHGKPHWDDNRLWTSAHHLYNRGMWLKKKSTLQAEGFYNKEISAFGYDLRTSGGDYENNDVHQGSPSDAEINKYFFLPSLGYCDGWIWSLQNSTGYYYTSTGCSDHAWRAFALVIDFQKARIYEEARIRGFIARPFSDFGDN